MTVSPYTRKELEGMKRSELQKLFKIHNLKGANGTNASLIDILSSHLAVTAYDEVNNIENIENIDLSEPVILCSSPQKQKQKSKPTLIRTSSKKGKEKEKASESDKLDDGHITSAQVEHLLIARDALWETRLASLAKSMGQVQDLLQVELKRLREDLEIVRNRCALLESSSRAGPSNSSGVLGKHGRGHSLGDSLTDEEVDIMGTDDESSEAKRVRFGGTSTPPPRASSEVGQATNITPRTPPPAHQGIRAEQWRTPRSTTREEHLVYQHQHQHHHHENGGQGSGTSLSLSDDDDDERVPEFGGTPKPPTERPSSPTPTMERILSSTSNSDREAAAAAAAAAMRARRAESVTLSNVTDLPRIEEGDEAASPFIRRALPKQRLSGLLGPPALIRRRADSERPDSSSRLAPGAIIGPGQGQGQGHNRTSSLSGAAGGGGGGGRPSRGASTPPRRLIPTEYESTLPGGGIRSASADYMHVAMHGLLGPPPSSTTTTVTTTTVTTARGTGVPPVTPGQRTMLGTERWNDTRFGDIPIPLGLGEEGNWESQSPKVDWLGGPATPL